MVAVYDEKIQVASAVMQETEEELSTLCSEIDNIVQNTLGTLMHDGSLSAEQRKQLSQECTKQNAAVLKKFSDIKKKQFKRLNDRMIEKKERKRTKLGENEMKKVNNLM